ncbi:MAG: hypothetical protein KJ042_09155 [Deltaproteobacteria bacterium]|nr:hypothetical protein [Deltaproteobacteria bacterium]
MSAGSLAVSAVLSLNARPFQQGIRASIDSLTDLATKVRESDSGFMHFIRSIDLVKAAAGGAAIALGVFAAGVMKAKDAAASGVELEIAITNVGDTPEQVEKKLAAVRKLALDVSKDVTGTKSDIELAFATALNRGVSVEALQAGVGKQGSLLADVYGVSKLEGMDSIRLLMDLFKMKPEQSGEVGDMIAKSMSVSGFTSPGQFAHELSRGGTTIARYAGDPGSAAILLSAISRIRPEGAGTAMEAFFRELNAPEKQKDMKKYGLDKFFKGGKLVGAEEMDQVWAAFAGKFKNEQERGRVLMKLFGAEGQLLGDVFMGTDFSDLAARRDKKLGLEGRVARKGKTLAYQSEAVGGTLESGVTELFMPAERAVAATVKSIGSTIVEPFSKFALESKGMQTATSIGLPVLGATLGAFALKGVLGRRGLGGTDMVDNATQTGIGVAKALALQKTTGGKVQPVFVVNWPGAKGGAGRATGGDVNASGAREIDFGDGAAAASLAKTGGSIWTRSFALPGALGKGATLTGAAGAGAFAAPIVIGAAGAMNYLRITGQAHAARDAADRADAKFDSTDVKSIVEQNVRNRATRGTKSKKDDMSEEEIQTEINRRLKGFQTEGGTGPTGVVDTWIDGMKRIFGGGEDAAKDQSKASKDLADAAGEIKVAAGEIRRAAKPMGGER